MQLSGHEGRFWPERLQDRKGGGPLRKTVLRGERAGSPGGGVRRLWGETGKGGARVCEAPLGPTKNHTREEVGKKPCELECSFLRR